MTPAEQVLWARLRNRQLAGLKFRRQHPIGRYIVDFNCPESGLVIELDGASHDHRVDEDMERTQWLEAQRLRVIRFTNVEVLKNLDGVLDAIVRACGPRGKCGVSEEHAARGRRPSPPAPLPKSGEGRRADV